MAYFPPPDDEGGAHGGWVQHTNRGLYRPSGGDLMPPYATKHNNDAVPAGIGEPAPKHLHAQHGRVYHEHHRVRFIIEYREIEVDRVVRG